MICIHLKLNEFILKTNKKKNKIIFFDSIQNKKLTSTVEVRVQESTTHIEIYAPLNMCGFKERNKVKIPK